jgi:hypothetical protein
MRRSEEAFLHHVKNNKSSARVEQDIKPCLHYKPKPGLALD